MPSFVTWIVAHWYLVGFAYAVLNEVFVAFPSFKSNTLAHAVFVALGWAKANPPALPKA